MPTQQPKTADREPKMLINLHAYESVPHRKARLALSPYSTLSRRERMYKFFLSSPEHRKNFISRAKNNTEIASYMRDVLLESGCTTLADCPDPTIPPIWVFEHGGTRLIGEWSEVGEFFYQVKQAEL
jgi:hypothetical protein